MLKKIISAIIPAVIAVSLSASVITASAETQKQFSSKTITVSGLSKTGYKYKQGDLIAPRPTVKYQGKILTRNKDYKFTYTNGRNIGKGRINIIGLGDYTGKVYVTYKIRETIQNADVTLSDTKVKVSYKGTELKENTDYTVKYTESLTSNPKAITAKITGIGFYYSSVEKSFTIENETKVLEDTYDETLVKLTNDFRNKNGVSSVTFDPELDKIANMRAQQLCIKYDHYYNGMTPGQQITNAGYKQTAWAENMAYGYTTPEETVIGWMNSSYHRTTMLNTIYNKIGIGYAVAKDGTTYWVQLYARTA